MTFSQTSAEEPSLGLSISIIPYFPIFLDLSLYLSPFLSHLCLCGGFCLVSWVGYIDRLVPPRLIHPAPCPVDLL